MKLQNINFICQSLTLNFRGRNINFVLKSLTFNLRNKKFRDDSILILTRNDYFMKWNSKFTHQSLLLNFNKFYYFWTKNFVTIHFFIQLFLTIDFLRNSKCMHIFSYNLCITTKIKGFNEKKIKEIINIRSLQILFLWF